ncbi:hypothetical protein FOQG_15148 [Fusarium oxysporum f. sp. raphani 54005]|uniref:Uncharacterized protein n=1 Tax=Fusarium oxysporum f. sp. raphani 54005 TaxID=1089458 RepID=X0BEX4_FUSOX|nr:hypothetical protein FOQG_15148 [Fusarium oxysporum f. sp. raphani 54005]
MATTRSRKTLTELLRLSQLLHQFQCQLLIEHQADVLSIISSLQGRTVATSRSNMRLLSKISSS